MKIKEQSKEGVVYQLEIAVISKCYYQLELASEESSNVFVNISYSGDKDEDGNEILEFCWASAELEDNGHLSEVEIDEANDILESGLEEQIVRFLMKHYKENTSIRFDVGEYDWIIENT